VKFRPEWVGRWGRCKHCRARVTAPGTQPAREPRAATGTPGSKVDLDLDLPRVEPDPDIPSDEPVVRPPPAIDRSDIEDVEWETEDESERRPVPAAPAVPPPPPATAAPAFKRRVGLLRPRPESAGEEAPPPGPRPRLRPASGGFSFNGRPLLAIASIIVTVLALTRLWQSSPRRPRRVEMPPRERVEVLKQIMGASRASGSSATPTP
jgi:hypothetical protein